MNSMKANPGEASEPGSGIPGKFGNYARLTEFRNALGANLRSGLDYLTPAETELASSYDIAELVAMIDNLADQVPVGDVGQSVETDLGTHPDAPEIPDAESELPALQQQFGKERDARLAAEQRETELRDKVAELSRSLADARAWEDGSKHGDADNAGVAIGVHPGKVSSAPLETRLRITQADSHDIEFVVDRDEISIGRTADNEIHIRSPSISRRHARIVRRNGHARIIDCDSKNGVYVNSLRVTEQELRDGDQIIVGTVELTFKERVIT